MIVSSYSGWRKFRPNRPGRPREDADDVKFSTYKFKKRGPIIHEMHVMIIISFNFLPLLFIFHSLLFRFCIWAFCTCYFYIPGSVCTMSLFIRCHTRSYLTTSHARTWKIPYPGLYVMIYTLFLRVVRFLSYICLIFNCHNILSWAIVILFFYTFLIIVVYMSRFILSTAFVILILVIILPPFIT